MIHQNCKWQPTPVFLPGKSHGWWNLVGYSPWGCKEPDTTEQLHFTSLSCCGIWLGAECPARDISQHLVFSCGCVTSFTRHLSSSNGGTSGVNILSPFSSYRAQISCVYVCVKSLSHVRLFVSPWTVARQAPLSMGFFRQEY